MMKIIALGASLSSPSINQTLAVGTAEMAAEILGGGEVLPLQLSDYEMPLYSAQRESDGGVPAQAHQFRADLAAGDAIVLSLAEYNGTLTAAFKNTFDWASRIDREVFGGRPMLLLATSPGRRGGVGALGDGARIFPRFGTELVGTMAVPSFGDNVDAATGHVTDPTLKAELIALIGKLK